MSQLIRNLTPLRDSSVLITAKQLITGLSMDFWCSSSTMAGRVSNTASEPERELTNVGNVLFLLETFN